MSKSEGEGSPVSTHRLVVRFAETDLMGIVHHANYLLYCEAARVDWLRKRGVSYEAWTQHGVHLPVVESRLRYKQPARFDDVLKVVTDIEKQSRVTVLFRYRIMRDQTLLCEAHTLLACVGENLKLKRFPPDVKEALARPELPPDAWAGHGLE
ncbi:MAG: thioesterase family protein [Myxococcota bacterium]